MLQTHGLLNNPQFLFTKKPNWLGSGGGDGQKTLAQILNDTFTVAWYQSGVGTTGTLNASAWANQLGAAGSLVQATGAAQPIVLSHSGSNYAYLSGVNGNGLTTPHSSGSTLTGDMSVVVTCSLNVVADTSQYNTFAAQTAVAGQYNWDFATSTSGVGGHIRFLYSVDGTAQVVLTSNQTLQAVGISNNQLFYIGVIHDVDNGAAGNDVKFYYSIDKTTWTQFGTTQTTAGTVTRKDSTGGLTAFSVLNSLSEVFSGKGYRVELYSGFYGGFTTPGAGAGSATLVADFNAADWSETTTNGATQASSTTGEVWTLNNTGTLPAQIVGSSQLLFDGTNDFMQAAFTLAQPTMLYLVAKRILVGTDDTPIDGATSGQMAIQRQSVTANSFRTYAGAFSSSNTDWTDGAYAIISSLFSGAASTNKVNNLTATTGSIGTASGDGLTVGALGSGANASNIQVKEIIVRSVADSAATQLEIIQKLAAKHGISL